MDGGAATRSGGLLPEKMMKRLAQALTLVAVLVLALVATAANCATARQRQPSPPLISEA